MTDLIACDLDGTLIYSRRRAGEQVVVDDLVCAERIDGAPASFLTRAAHAAIVDLDRMAYVIPVTTRSREQFDRVTLPLTSRHAVAANGGLLLADGRVDDSWSAAVAQRLRGVAPVEQAARHLEQACRPGWTKRMTVVEALFCCAVVDVDALPADFMAERESWADVHGWRASLQGSKLYLVPGPLTKSAAVAEVARRVGAQRVFAAGDAVLDIDLLRSATRGVHPSAGELATRGWSAPNVVRVPGTGVVGGEQIVEWLRLQVSGDACDGA
jgi:hydroxymethylpyrimidine pyrophosphatase-like HAD family hydrolase